MLRNYEDMKRELDANIKRGRYNFKKIQRATYLHYAPDGETIELRHWGTAIQTWHKDGTVKIASSHCSITTNQRHKNWLPTGNISSHKGDPLFFMYGVNLVLPSGAGFHIHCPRCWGFLNSPIARIYQLGMRQGDIPSFDAFTVKLRQLGCEDFAEVFRYHRGEKYGWRRNKVKEELRQLDEPNTVDCTLHQYSGYEGSYRELKDCPRCNGTAKVETHEWLFNFETLEAFRPLSNRDVALYWDDTYSANKSEITIEGVRYAVAIPDASKGPGIVPNEEFISNWLDKHYGKDTA